MRSCRPSGLAGLLSLLFFFVASPSVWADVSASTSPHQIGYYCVPYTESYVEGGYYSSPSNMGCLYSGNTIPNTGPGRYGGVFRGVIGSSTVVNAHYLGPADARWENDDSFPDPQQGESLFSVIWWERALPFWAVPDSTNFVNYFTTGAIPPPHNDYGFINWKYGTAPVSNTATVTAPVIIVPGVLGSAQKNGVWVLDPIMHTYDDLVDTLLVNGYQKDITLFTFPYDWHKSNIDTATLLKQKIDSVKTICQCDKVDIVAHSMGGLAARQYIQSGYYGNDVRKIIFLGTPHLGAPKDYLIWEGGEMEANRDDQRVRVFLRLEALKHGYISLYDYIRNSSVPSVRELLPVFSYLKVAQPPVLPITQDTVFTFTPVSYPTGYPTNPFLENLNNQISNFLNAGISISNIVGELPASTTITSLRVIPQSIIQRQYWPDGYPQGFSEKTGDQGLERGSGDGTVTLNSAGFIEQNKIVINADHQHLPGSAASSTFNLLTGKSPLKVVSDGLYIDSKELIIQILSPADITVVAPDGKKMGKDFSTGQELSEIPGAFYSGFETDDEYITIPDPLSGVYKVFTQGTGTGGHYTIATSFINDSTSTDALFAGQTIPGLITEHRVTLDVEHPEYMSIGPVDVLPPTIVVAQPATTTYLHSDTLPIHVDVADVTGVASTSVRFDTRSVQASSTVDLFYEKLGNHTIVITAGDLLGNSTTSTTSIQVIATASSTIADIQRVYALGWITTLKFRDLLVQQVLAAVKIQKTLEMVQGKKVERLYQVLDKIVLKLALATLELAKGKTINQQGYQILKDDINWLISH